MNIMVESKAATRRHGTAVAESYILKHNYETEIDIDR